MVFAGLGSKLVVTVSSGLASKSVATVFGGLASKPAVTIFYVLASKPVETVFSSLGSKLVATVSPSLTSKPKWWRVSRFGDLDLKITATVSWFGPQNQVSFGLSVAPQNRRREISAGHASRSSGLLCVEASLARVS
jgi:hypothetical protein